jgi:putative membrane protein
MLRWLLAAFHLLAFGIGLGAVWVRARALQGLPDPNCLRRVLRADAWWGVAALVWLATGLPRLLLSTEKPTAYYLGNHLFWLKMALFLLVVVLELGPMLALTRWRGALRRGQTADTTLAPRWALISRIEVGLVVLLLFVATAVARGYGIAPVRPV